MPRTRRAPRRKQRGGDWIPQALQFWKPKPAPALPAKVDPVADAVVKTAESAAAPLPSSLTDTAPAGLPSESSGPAPPAGPALGGRRRSKRRKHRKSTKRR